MDKTIAKLGFYSALISFIAALGYCIVQVLQVLGFITYPQDAILIYAFSLGIATPFMLAILALHYTVPGTKKIWSHAGLLFALMYATYVTLMYGVQLATVIPASPLKLGNDVLTVTPHSLFWTIDALGYICMGLATLFAAPAFARDGIEGWTRKFFIANGLMIPFISIAYFYPHFSIVILFLGAPWMITAPGSILLLALFFKKRM